MTQSSVSNPRIASSIRLILAMFRLYADIETSFGKAILDILKKQYPDQNIDIHPATIGHKLMAIARKQNQNDDSRAMDAIQDFLTYISTGSRFEIDESGEKVERKTAKPWDFAKDSPTWQEALSKIYSNVRRRSMDKSMDNSRRKKLEKSVDDAFGKRGEGGGSPEGGEGHMPDTESMIGKALDDKTAIKEFMDVIDSYIPELKASLSPAELALFELIFDDGIGGFGSDIKDNMNQASSLKEKHPDLYKKNEKRWSGFVGDTRKKLLESIWNFIDSHMTPGDYKVLKDTFFADTTPQEVRSLEKGKGEEKKNEEIEQDKRSIAKWKWQQENGTLSEKDAKSLENRMEKLKDLGIDVDAIKPEEKPKKPKAPKAESKLASIAGRVASRFLTQ